MDSIEHLKQTTRVVEASIVDAPNDDSFNALFATLFDEELVGVERY